MRTVQKSAVWLVVGVVLFCAALLTLLSITLASAKTPMPPHTWYLQVGAESKDHAIQNMTFFPGDTWINAGDKIVWTSGSDALHTVTFLKPGQPLPAFNLTDPRQYTRTLNSQYAGNVYSNSGILLNDPYASAILPPSVTPYKTFSLTFIKEGAYTYVSLTHSGMVGHVHVRATGTPYPKSQADYDSQFQAILKEIAKDSNQLIKKAQASSTNHRVLVGTGDIQVNILRFFPQQISIYVGETVSFINNDPLEPHTVTYGTLKTPATLPTGDPAHFIGDHNSPLNSGILLYGALHPYTITFLRPGTYSFRCDLHGYLGMVLTVRVQ